MIYQAPIANILTELVVGVGKSTFDEDVSDMEVDNDDLLEELTLDIILENCELDISALLDDDPTGNKTEEGTSVEDADDVKTVDSGGRETRDTVEEPVVDWED